MEQKSQLTKFLNLKIFRGQFHYVHQNAAELVSNLVQLVGAGILSKKPARKNLAMENNEWDRIMREYKNSNKLTLLYQLENQENENKEGNAK